MTQIYKKVPSTPKAALNCVAPVDSHLNAEFFKALGDTTRLGLLSCLLKCVRPCTVSEIAECCHVDLSVVSRHLKILEDAEIVQSRKEGRTVWYQVEIRKLAGTFRDIATGMEECLSKKRLTSECC